MLRYVPNDLYRYLRFRAPASFLPIPYTPAKLGNDYSMARELWVCKPLDNVGKESIGGPLAHGFHATESQ